MTSHAAQTGLAHRATHNVVTALRRFASLFVISTFIALAGCTLPDAGVDAAGDLKLLYAPFSLSQPPRYWYVTQRPHGGRQIGMRSQDGAEMPLEWQDTDGRIALAARPGIGSFEIGRRTNVIILASPYLSFDWQMNSTAKVGDVELVLGFRRQSQGSWTEGDLGSGKPPIDQLVRIPIGQEAADDGTWHTEYFDLSTLYRHYWPEAQNDEVRLVWIGLVSGNQHAPSVSGITHMTHILLSR